MARKGIIVSLASLVYKHKNNLELEKEQKNKLVREYREVKLDKG